MSAPAYDPLCGDGAALHRLYDRLVVSGPARDSDEGGGGVPVASRPTDDDRLLQAQIRLAHASDAWMDAQDAFELAKQNYHFAFDEVTALRRQMTKPTSDGPR